MLMLGHLAGGVVSAYYAAEWKVGNIVGNSLASTAVSPPGQLNVVMVTVSVFMMLTL